MEMQHSLEEDIVALAQSGHKNNNMHERRQKRGARGIAMYEKLQKLNGKQKKQGNTRCAQSVIIEDINLEFKISIIDISIKDVHCKACHGM